MSSAKAIELAKVPIKMFEGRHLRAYLCPAKIPTVGFGSIYHYDLHRPVRLGDVITATQAEDFLNKEIEQKIIPTAEKFPFWSKLGDNQKAALIDFMYNLGSFFYGRRGFETISLCLGHLDKKIPVIPSTLLNLHTDLLQEANLPRIDTKKSYTGNELMPYAFLLYNKAGTQTLPGLTSRRIYEKNMWIEDKIVEKPFVIIAVAETVLKKSTANSDQLPASSLADVPLGRAYTVEQILGEENNHLHIRISHGAGDWYIYKPHWDKWAAVRPLPSVDKSFPQNISDVNWGDMSFRFGKYFTLGEYVMGDRRRLPVTDEVKRNTLRIMRELNQIREDWGKPIRITSGHRPVRINAAVGGVSDSRHVIGDAVDIADAAGQTMALQRWLDHRWEGRLGYGASYKGFVHIDMKNNRGYNANGARTKGVRWNY